MSCDGGAAIGPGLEQVALLARRRLGRGGGERVARADDDAARERGRRLRAVEAERQAARARRQREVDRARVEPDAPRVAQPAGVGRRKPELEVGGVLVVGRGERSLIDAEPGLDRVRVAVAGAVLEDQRPRQVGGRQGTVLRVGGRAAERDQVADLPRRPGRGQRDRRGRRRVADGDRHGVGRRGAPRVGHPQPRGTPCRTWCRSTTGWPSWSRRRRRRRRDPRRS